MNERLVLAYAIGEWASAVEHLDALNRIEAPVPWAVYGRVTSELLDLCQRWTVLNGGIVAENRDDVVRQARAYCTEHMAEIDELLNGE